MKLKALTTAIPFIFFLGLHAQSEDPQLLLDSAKALFKSERSLNQKQQDSLNYAQIVHLLDRVIELSPENAEAYYFLGYTYSRINSWDGRGMIDMDLDLVYQASAAFERVNTLSPLYTGELVLLDPYSKLTAEWGSMAMCYWHRNQLDSAQWAFEEGKRRGGFGPFMLDMNRKVLDACSPNAILISSGDNFTFPLWYLQRVEKYRPDVSVVDISLLNTKWYPAFLSQANSVSFDLPKEVLDTLEYIRWSESRLTIANFSWTVSPTYYDQFLLRGDLVFLSLLKANSFERDLFFTLGFNEKQRLSLTEFMQSLGVVDKLVLSKNSDLVFVAYEETVVEALKLSKVLNPNSLDELRCFDNIRYGLLAEIRDCLRDGDKKRAKRLLDLLDQHAPSSAYPYLHESGRKYEDLLRGML